MAFSFTRSINAGNKLREFHFSQVNDARYYVDVTDDRDARVRFTVYKNAKDEWKVAAQLMPIWIHNAEEDLAIAIRELNSAGVK